MWEILQLDITTGESTGAVGSVKLKHTSGTAISADRVFHCLIFSDGGLCQLLAQEQNICKLRWCLFQKLVHSLFIKAVRLHTVVGKPLLHLLDAVGIFQSGHVFHGGGQLLSGQRVHFNGLCHQLHIQTHTGVVDFLTLVILIPDRLRYRELCQALLDTHFCFHISKIVFFEGVPLVRCMEGSISGALVVGFRRSARLAEILDEVFAFSKLLLLKAQNSTDTFQRQRQSHSSGPDHGAAPAFGI